jgi:Mg2+ and Co2+ transporter CorA
VLTAVTGFYGMNVPYPGFARPSGVVTSVVPIPALQTPGMALSSDHPQ